jgi:hypothetical protein
MIMPAEIFVSDLIAVLTNVIVQFGFSLVLFGLLLALLIQSNVWYKSHVEKKLKVSAVWIAN